MSTKVSPITKVKETFRQHPERAVSGQANPQALDAGPADLVVSTLRLEGIVRGPNEIVAVVSNSQQRVFFLREGDQLFDGKVELVTLEAVTFHEVTQDVFGKPIKRRVIKRLYPRFRQKFYEKASEGR